MSRAVERRPVKPAILKDSAFPWEGLPDLEGEPAEEERMVRDAERGFAQDYPMPKVIEANAHETYDADMLPEVGKLGLIGPILPEQYNGAGLGHVSYAQIGIQGFF